MISSNPEETKSKGCMDGKVGRVPEVAWVFVYSGSYLGSGAMEA